MSPTVSVPAEQADWIAKHVLTHRYLKSCGGINLVRLCSCQYGPCGHCSKGTHASCSTRRHPELSRPRSHTHVVSRDGAALTEVWTVGGSCRWVCPCRDPAHSAPPADQASSAAVQRAPGGLRPGDTVWLTPKTRTCPRICWQRPRCTVVAVGYPYVEVKAGRTVHRIHVDNIRRSDPTGARGVMHVKPRQRPALPDGFEEAPLF
jgi:hypothetical protein